MTKCTGPSTEQVTSEPAAGGEPPMKKQKVEGGAAIVTASANITESSTEKVVAKTSGKSRKRKRSKRSKNKFQNPCHEMAQYKCGDFLSILWMYCNMKKCVKKEYPVCKTINDPELKLPGVTSFFTTCKVVGIIGKGRANTKRKSKQLACLSVIQRLGLVPKEIWVDTLAFSVKKSVAVKSQKKPIKPVIEYSSYLQGNFKGTLEVYLRQFNPPNRIILKSDPLPPNDNNEIIFVTSCCTVKGDHIGTARHKIKKKSVQLACLQCMLSMKLITKEEHLQKHPAPIATDVVAQEDKEAGESSKLEKTPNVKEDVVVEKPDETPNVKEDVVVEKPEETPNVKEDIIVEKPDGGESAKVKAETDNNDKGAEVKQDTDDSSKMPEEAEVSKEV